MKGAATLLILVAFGVSGCGSLTEQPAVARRRILDFKI